MMVLGVGSVGAWSYPKEAVKTPPIVVVDSPLQGAYTTSNVTLSFSVNQSESWYRDGGTDAYFRKVTYQLDSNEPVVVWTSPQFYANDTPGRFTETLIGLENGSHTLLINVTIDSPYDIFSPGDPHGHFARAETWNWTKTVSFIVDPKADANQELGTVPPDATTKPSIITVFSPLNGSVYAISIIPLSVNVTLPKSSTASLTIIYSIIYQADWLQDQVFLYSNAGLENSIQSQMPGAEHQYFQKSLNLTNIPQGNHSITITAVAGGIYPAENMSQYRFYINGSSTVNFTIDTSTPSPSLTPNLSPSSTSNLSLTPSPSVPEFPSWIVLPFLVTATALSGILIRRRRAIR
jgi:hypothetical protein